MRIRIIQGAAAVRLCELEDKEVINTCDCKKLGYIVVPRAGKFCGLFGDGAEYIIPFRCIKRIGPDIILVEICDEK